MIRKFLCDSRIVDQVIVARFMVQQRKQKKSLDGRKPPWSLIQLDCILCYQSLKKVQVLLTNWTERLLMFKGLAGCWRIFAHGLLISKRRSLEYMQSQTWYRGDVLWPVELGKQEPIWVSNCCCKLQWIVKSNSECDNCWPQPDIAWRSNYKLKSTHQPT